MFYTKTNTQNMRDLKTKKIPFTVVQKNNKRGIHLVREVPDMLP